MKKTTYPFHTPGFISFIIFSTALLFTSCEKEEDKVTRPDPVINIVTSPDFVSSDTTMSVGQTFTVSIHAESNGYDNLTNFIAILNGERYLDLGLYAETYDREIEISKGLENTDVWDFIIRDIEGNSATTSITISKNPDIVYGEIIEYSDVKLGAQNNTEFGSFFSLTNGNVYDLEGGYNNQELIDIVTYYDDFDKLDKWILASPAANIGDEAFPGEFALSNWTTTNTTRYPSAAIDVTADEFDAAHNDSILLANSFAFDSGKRKAKDLSAGDIFSFVREDNLTGMFKVVSTSGTTDGYIIVDIKFQKK